MEVDEPGPAPDEQQEQQTQPRRSSRAATTKQSAPTNGKHKAHKFVDIGLMWLQRAKAADDEKAVDAEASDIDEAVPAKRGRTAKNTIKSKAVKAAPPAPPPAPVSATTRKKRAATKQVCCFTISLLMA